MTMKGEGELKVVEPIYGTKRMLKEEDDDDAVKDNDDDGRKYMYNTSHIHLPKVFVQNNALYKT